MSHSLRVDRNFHRSYKAYSHRERPDCTMSRVWSSRVGSRNVRETSRKQSLLMSNKHMSLQHRPVTTGHAHWPTSLRGVPSWNHSWKTKWKFTPASGLLWVKAEALILKHMDHMYCKLHQQRRQKEAMFGVTTTTIESLHEYCISQSHRK